MDNRAIYANFMSIILSETDCDLAFKTIVPNQDAAGIVLGNIISDSVNVFMNISQAKTLLNLLKQQIDDFEKVHGVLSSSNMNVTMRQDGTSSLQVVKDMATKI